MTGAPADARTRPRRRPTPASLGNVYEKRYHETVISVAISADDSFFAAGGAGRKAMVWRVEDGELFASFETRDTITSIAFVGDALLAGTFDKKLHGFSLRISAASEQGGAGERSLFNQELFSESFPGQVTAISCATDSADRGSESALIAVGGTDRNVILYTTRAAATPKEPPEYAAASGGGGGGSGSGGSGSGGGGGGGGFGARGRAPPLPFPLDLPARGQGRLPGGLEVAARIKARLPEIARGCPRLPEVARGCPRYRLRDSFLTYD